MFEVIEKLAQLKGRPLKQHDEDRREYFAHKYIRGHGVEIGALHNPVKLRQGVSVKYVDYKSTRENRKRYPELKDNKIVDTNIIDNGFFLKKIKNKSLDFIIANHFLEHSPDPIGTIYTLRNKLKKNGIIFAAVPLLDNNYDKGRRLTTLKHLINDHSMFQEPKKNLNKISGITRQHLVEFVSISDGNIRHINGLEPKFTNLQDAEKEADRILKGFNKSIECLISVSLSNDELREKVLSAHIYKLNLIYDIHYHTFTAESYRDLFQYIEGDSKGGLKLIDIGISGVGEVIAVARNMHFN